jgi:hypothetical protein
MQVPREDFGPWIELPGAVGLEHVATAFERPVAHLAGFTDEQLQVGLWLLVASGGGDQLWPCTDDSIPLEPTLRAICGGRARRLHPPSPE